MRSIAAGSFAPVFAVTLAVAFAGVRSVLAADEGPVHLEDPVHPKEYWQSIVAHGFEVPAGEEPFALLEDLLRALGSVDPELRDDCGYGITYQWVVKRGLLEPEDCLALVDTLIENLERGIGEVETDSVLLRSFSALDLSLFAMRDLEAPFLERADFARLLDAALTYLEGEKDLRGFDPQRGWMHSVAHTADLLRFLARNPRLDDDGMERILAGIAHKVVAAGEVFVHGEDDRLAAVLSSLVAREDFDEKLLDPFFDVLERGKSRRPGAPAFDPLQHAARENGVHLLRALFVTLCARSSSPAPWVAARERVLQRLTTL